MSGFGSGPIDAHGLGEALKAITPTVTPPQPRKVGEVALREVLALCACTTSGEWVAEWTGDEWRIENDRGAVAIAAGMDDVDSAAIVAAVNWTRTHAAPLLAEIEALRVERDGLRALAGKWRDSARLPQGEANTVQFRWRSVTLTDCADELSAALRDKESGE